ncbi:hypothetical protein COL0002_03940 [Helicobacter pylori]
MPLPFILGGLVIAATGYGVKKILDAKSANDEAKDLFKKAEELLEETKKKVELAQSDCKNALMRLGEKKFHVISRGVSRFVEHFNQLEGHEFVINNMDIQNIQEQVSEALNVVNKCKEMGLSDFLASLGGVGTAAWMSGVAISLGGWLPALAILGALSAKKMEEKLEDAKAYLSQVEVAVKKADVAVDNLLAVERVAKLFTRQITKCDALFFSLSQDAIATMKKHNYNHSLYSQEEKDQLFVGFAVRISPGLLSLLGLMLAMGCASFWI